MPPPRAADLAALLEEERARGSFPSVQALVLERGEARFEHVAGDAVVEPERRPAGPATLYDLASLTKPLVTARLALELASEGVLPLEAPLGDLLPLSGSAYAEATVLDLLTHRAGFPAWAPLYLETGPPLARFAERALARAPEHEPGSRVLYSDLGFLVLGAAIERAAGRPFPELARSLLGRALGGGGREPQGSPEACLPPLPQERERCAATERGNEHERRLAGAPAGDPRFRAELVWGAVHDGNAHALGGAAPHAGLFATARATARLAAAYLEAGALPAAARALALADLTPGDASGRSAAFELARSRGSAAQGSLPGDAVGHTGFTGTSLWIEPGPGRLYVLLTNRVHPEAREVAMNAVRRRFHAAARAFLEAGRPAEG